jgi:hypothetical protein
MMLPTAVGAALAIKLFLLIVMLPTGNAALAIGFGVGRSVGRSVPFGVGRSVGRSVPFGVGPSMTMLPTGNAALAVVIPLLRA